MNHYRLVFRQEALLQLEELYDFIADAGSPATAAGFTESIVAFCEGLADFPYRGLAREDLRPGLRTIGFSLTTAARGRRRTNHLPIPSVSFCPDMPTS